jgi:hypothetical protein
MVGCMSASCVGLVFEVDLMCSKVLGSVWRFRFEGERLFDYIHRRRPAQNQELEGLGPRTWCARTDLQTLQSMPMKTA